VIQNNEGWTEWYILVVTKDIKWSPPKQHVGTTALSHVYKRVIVLDKNDISMFADDT